MTRPDRLTLPPADRHTLALWARSRLTPQAVALRSRIILLLADGLSGRAVAHSVGVSRHTVDLWRKRYRAGGCHALSREKAGRGRRRGNGIVLESN